MLIGSTFLLIKWDSIVDRIYGLRGDKCGRIVTLTTGQCLAYGYSRTRGLEDRIPDPG